MSESYYQPRQYILDGKSIILDKYADVEKEKYDQTFDDVVESQNFNANSQINQSQNPTNQNFNNNNSTMNNLINDYYYNSQNPYNNNTNYNQSNLKQTGFSENPNVENQKTQYNLVPQILIENLQNYFYRQKGYMPTNPDSLFKYFLDFRVQKAKGLRINKQINELLNYSDDDVLYSIKELNRVMMENLNNGSRSTNPSSFYFKTGEGQNIDTRINYFQPTGLEVTNQFKPKFTKDTMRRLYPKQKQLEDNEKNRLNCYDFQSYFPKLLDEYRKKNNTLTNNPNKLLNFWKEMDENELKKKGLQWENGEKDFEQELNLFLSDDEIVNRLISIFKKVCGYETNHPRPIHDYWQYKIKDEDKYYKGLFKYGKENLYKLLEEKFDEKDKEKKDKLQKEIEKQKELKKIEAENKKLNKEEEEEELQKKFDELSKPKDRYKTGRVMLKLQEQFKYDNIIKKMIKSEFQDNKLFKFPEEYAVRDNDEQRKIIFKNSLEKGYLDNKKRDKIENKNKELMLKTNEVDQEKEDIETKKRYTIEKEDKELEKYIKQMVIKYYKKMKDRLSTGKIESQSKFLNAMYQEMSKKFPEATKRHFKKTNYGVLKKAYKYKKLHIYYPESLKYYFFQLLRRLGINDKGKYVFAKTDNLSFWGPSLSNACKVHTNGCPLYCTHNTHNDMILQQREKNFSEIFSLNNGKLEKDEKFNFWKRPELIKEKEKIFMCLDEAKHCTFEPNICKTKDDIAKLEALSPQEIVDRRVSNMKWVNEMGTNFTKFPVVFKDGICKKAKILFNEGRYEECKKLLEKAFYLDDLKAYFDPKFAEKLKKQRREERLKEGKEDDPNEVFKREENKKKKEIMPDNFNNPKNKEICYDVYIMLKAMEDYKKNKNKAVKKLKEEIKMIEFNKNPNNQENADPKFNETNPQFKYLKDKYFTMFRTIMCPLKDQCPLDLRPRWPHSDLGAGVPFGGKCPYAHQISELKFEQEINEKIKLRKNLLKTLEKDEDPIIEESWVPAGPIISCTGCGKTFTEKEKGKKGGGSRVTMKGLCGFCRYNQKNELDLKKDQASAKKSNEKILKKMNYQGKPEEIDQDYMKKFGQLKKAISLYSFRRYVDALNIMKKLKEKVDKEQVEINNKFKSLDEKWRKKLEIKEEINPEILDYQINQNVLNYFKIKIPLNTLLVYCDKMRKGNKYSIYNRHTYLNRKINEFYNTCVKTIKKYDVDAKHLVRQIEELDEWMSKKDRLKTENNKKELYKKMVGKYKTEMCPNIIKLGHCPDSFSGCKYAHNPNQLNLIPPQKDKQLMKNNLSVTLGKKEKSVVIVPWSYPKQGFIEAGPKFEKSLVKQYGKEYKRAHSAKKFKKTDIEKLKIKVHEI
jgi:hypothetical protein